MTNYDENNSAVIHNLGMYFTEIENIELMNLYENVPVPELISDPILKCEDNSLFNKIFVEYTFNNVQGMKEQDSIITWYLTRNENTTIVAEYQNRTVQPLVDVWKTDDTLLVRSGRTFQDGDIVYVTVKPSDGLTDASLVATYESNHITLTEV